MSRQKVQPGTMLNFLSPEEFLDGLKEHGNSLIRALGRNAIFKRAIIGGQSDASGNFRITCTPPPGFIWEVHWVQWAGSSIATSNMNMYISDTTPLNALGYNFVSGTNPQLFPTSCIVIYAPDQLIFTQGNVAVSPNVQINIQLGILEVPFGHESQLV